MMNKLYIFLVATAITLSACNNTIDEHSDQTLNGKWILVNVSGGIAGEINNIDTLVEKHIVVFDKDNSVSFFYNDSLLSSTNFLIEKRKSIYSTNELDFIVYEYGSAPKVITYLFKDTLIIADNYYDGFSSVYIKVSD
jgi:hypothetical protein